MGVPHRIEYQDTYSVVTSKDQAGRDDVFSLCSRLRRGNLYRIAREEGCSAVVLGHHRDDILETFFMNLFHGGRLATMPPKLVNEEGDLFVYRPLAFVARGRLRESSPGRWLTRSSPATSAAARRAAARPGEKAPGRMGDAHARAAAGDVPQPDERAALALADPGIFDFRSG